jgi:hypothetical protein
VIASALISGREDHDLRLTTTLFWALREQRTSCDASYHLFLNDMSCETGLPECGVLVFELAEDVDVGDLRVLNYGPSGS